MPCIKVFSLGIKSIHQGNNHFNSHLQKSVLRSERIIFFLNRRINNNVFCISFFEAHFKLYRQCC